MIDASLHQFFSTFMHDGLVDRSDHVKWCHCRC
jgi:hypothetical protein